jgi:hypothetical protein
VNYCFGAPGRAGARPARSDLADPRASQSALKIVYGCVILVAVSVSSGRLGARKQSG